VTTRLLSFELGGEPFALRIELLGKVAPLPDGMREVPGAPGSVAGVAELHGAILTVVDPAAALGLDWCGEDAHVAVLQPPRQSAALLLRGAVDIVAFEGGELVVDREHGPFLEGVWVAEEESRSLLDPIAVIDACSREITERRSVEKRDPMPGRAGA
jgi:chemotaxis signal transduction protein